MPLITIMGGVAAGLGISLLTRSSVKDWVDAGKLQAFQIPKRYRSSKVHFVFRRNLFRTSAFNHFIEQFEKTE
ncbi:LysR substrate-binding domain-containing protein [Paenibacillus lautus]|uniref:LysR substrate-binding domain-containing protein n=1 Tax=Paenibacillus lautus TaxID=1401 RepID=UPI002176B073|nr:LysR substrate-binding domain-containing protein [Paenibacillus lautus]